MSLAPRTSLEAYHSEIEAKCPMGDVKLWRTVKGLLYAVLISLNAAMGLYFDGMIIALAAIATILIVSGVELKEIQIAHWVTITFDRDDER